MTTLQKTLDTPKGVRLTTPKLSSLAELYIIQNLIDSMLADRPSEEVEANLYSSRHHISRAIKIQEAA